MMALTQYLVWIYRPADGHDATNRGVTSRCTKAILYRNAADAASHRNERMAALVLDETRIRAVPAGETGWTMFGGNFIWSSDSRFRNEVSERPIPVHDRIEGRIASLTDAPDPRDPRPDHEMVGRAPIFRDHNCYRCKDGTLPCVRGKPHSLNCEYPHARND